MNNKKFPKLTVDAIVVKDDKILLIERKNPPYGWALPGGFVDYGETVEEAVIRELKEETGLIANKEKIKQFHVYSDPERDTRGHTVSVVFIVPEVDGTPAAADDAKNLSFFPLNALPDKIAFDHEKIIQDWKRSTSPKDEQA